MDKKLPEKLCFNNAYLSLPSEWDASISQLEMAVAIQDSLPYMEPPAWYFPIRHLLGAELLAADRAEEAAAIYRKDLEQYPANGWSIAPASCLPASVASRARSCRRRTSRLASCGSPHPIR